MNIYVKASLNQKKEALSEVEIGGNRVIGAGSVVVKSIPKNSIAVGNPCRVIGSVG